MGRERDLCDLWFISSACGNRQQQNKHAYSKQISLMTYSKSICIFNLHICCVILILCFSYWYLFIKFIFYLFIILIHYLFIYLFINLLIDFIFILLMMMIMMNHIIITLYYNYYCYYYYYYIIIIIIIIIIALSFPIK